MSEIDRLTERVVLAVRAEMRQEQVDTWSRVEVLEGEKKKLLHENDQLKKKIELLEKQKGS
jgi:malate/lactate dehydrogenase